MSLSGISEVVLGWASPESAEMRDTVSTGQAPTTSMLNIVHAGKSKTTAPLIFEPFQLVQKLAFGHRYETI